MPFRIQAEHDLILNTYGSTASPKTPQIKPKQATDSFVLPSKDGATCTNMTF